MIISLLQLNVFSKKFGQFFFFCLFHLVSKYICIYLFRIFSYDILISTVYSVYSLCLRCVWGAVLFKCLFFLINHKLFSFMSLQVLVDPHWVLLFLKSLIFTFKLYFCIFLECAMAFAFWFCFCWNIYFINVNLSYCLFCCLLLRLEIT